MKVGDKIIITGSPQQLHKVGLGAYHLGEVHKVIYVRQDWGVDVECGWSFSKETYRPLDEQMYFQFSGILPTKECV